VKGLLNKETIDKPKNFREWLQNGFGKGIMDVFLVPYNRKVWGYDPSDMNVEWMGERVATVDTNRVIDNIITGQDDVGWGPNATFRFPLKGGTGVIWKGVYNLINKENVRLDSTVVGVDADAKVVKLADGSEVKFDYLVSTMPLDIMCKMVQGKAFSSFPELAPKFRYSSTNIVGLGIKGKCPKELSTKCWMYFPEDNCPFYRVTVFSKYSPLNVPNPGEEWSLMFEVCETEMRPVNYETIVQDVIQGALNTKLIKPTTKIVSKYYRRFEHGYPTPFAGRDQLCAPIFSSLEEHGIFSRGRFGAWKYEVSNQDHTFMQGVEAVDHILYGSEEVTFRFPGVVNRRDWKDVGRVPRAQPTQAITYHDPEEVIRQYKNDLDEEKKANDSDSDDGQPEPGTPWTEGKLEDAGKHIKRIVLVDMDNCLVDWESRFEEMMQKHHPEIPLVPRSKRLSWNHAMDYPKEHREAVQKICGMPGFFEGMKANPGGIKAIEEMADDGNEVFLVSSPDPQFYAQCSAEKYNWVKKNLGQDWLSKVILTRDKTTVQGHILIDDKPKIEGAVTPNWTHIVFTQTYNKTVDSKRLDKWSDWRSVFPCKIPLNVPNKNTLYPNGINFSCVFPSFNQYEIVRKTLAGLAMQKIESDFKFEVIIVDNNSTDDIHKIYMDYRDKLDLRLIQRRKLENTFSVPSARNMGILEAKYDYIVGMDSDVIFDEYALENLYKFLSSRDQSTPYIVTAERYFVDTEQYKDDQILADFSICKKFERILSKANYFKPRDNRFSHGNVLENVRNNVHPYAYFYGMHTAFPRKIWEAIGGYNEVYDGWWGYDDIEFAYRMMVDGGCIPVLLAGTEVYHQEPYGSGWVPLGGVVNKDGSANPRLNKKANPNWQRICDTIPGYAEWKKDHYERLAGDIITL